MVTSFYDPNSAEHNVQYRLLSRFFSKVNPFFRVVPMNDDRYLSNTCTPALSLPCFDLQRCRSVVQEASAPLPVYCEDDDDTTTDSFSHLAHLALQEGTIVRVDAPEKACLIVHYSRQKRKHNGEKHQYHGPNHFVWQSHCIPGCSDQPWQQAVDFGWAALATANLPTLQFRLGYDVSIPLPPQWRPAKNDDRNNNKRERPI